MRMTHSVQGIVTQTTITTSCASAKSTRSSLPGQQLLYKQYSKDCSSDLLLLAALIDRALHMGPIKVPSAGLCGCVAFCRLHTAHLAHCTMTFNNTQNKNVSTHTSGQQADTQRG